MKRTIDQARFFTATLLIERSHSAARFPSFRTWMVANKSFRGRVWGAAGVGVRAESRRSGACRSAHVSRRTVPSVLPAVHVESCQVSRAWPIRTVPLIMLVGTLHNRTNAVCCPKVLVEQVANPSKGQRPGQNAPPCRGAWSTFPSKRGRSGSLAPPDPDGFSQHVRGQGLHAHSSAFSASQSAGPRRCHPPRTGCMRNYPRATFSLVDRGSVDSNQGRTSRRLHESENAYAYGALRRRVQSRAATGFKLKGTIPQSLGGGRQL